jgi:SAM-dependent methyltransferase
VNLIEYAHGAFVASRRARAIADHLARVIPPHASVLDVGCGDGQLAALLLERRPDLTIAGVDVLVRDDTYIPVERFDGRRLPAGDGAYDVVMFVDVLHHCDNQLELLAEARRVARRAVVIKDHVLRGFAARQTLRFMDGVGNRRYGVSLPFNYWRAEQWSQAFASLDLAVEQQIDHLGLYPWPMSSFFDRKLHFLAVLQAESVPCQTRVESDADRRPVGSGRP